MTKMGYRNGYTLFDKFDFRALNIKADEKNHRRDTFALQEYDAVVRFMRRYVADEELKNENERLERMLIRDCVLIASNTMLRVGELWALKWGDIESIRVERDENGNEVHLVKINVREETSKVRKSRWVISRGGEYFERLKYRAEYGNDDSFIFCGIGGDKKISRQKCYIH
jgi:integrase